MNIWDKFTELRPHEQFERLLTNSASFDSSRALADKAVSLGIYTNHELSKIGQEQLDTSEEILKTHLQKYNEALKD